jgi:rhomboid protease GluP
LNSITLYFIGQQVEALYGHTRYAAIYLLSGIAGNVLSFALNIDGVSAGASTAIFGLFGAFAVLKRYFPENPIVQQMASQYGVLIVLNLVFDLFDSSIDIWGHVGGLVGGGLIAVAVAIPKQSERYNIHERIIAGIIFIFVIGFFIALGFKKYGII